jgi:hypothetical protein
VQRSLASPISSPQNRFRPGSSLWSLPAPPMPLRLGQQEPMSQAMHRRSDDQEGLTHLDWVNEDLPRLGHENLIEHCRLSTRWGVDGQLHEERPARRPASSHLAGKSLKYLAAQR